MRVLLLIIGLSLTSFCFGQDSLIQQVADDIRIIAQESPKCGMGPDSATDLLDKKIAKMHAFYLEIVPWYVHGDSSYRIKLENELKGIENEKLGKREIDISSGSFSAPYLKYADSREEGIKWELIFISKKQRCKLLIPLLASYVPDHCFEPNGALRKPTSAKCVLEFDLYVYQLFTLHNENLSCKYLRYLHNHSAYEVIQTNSKRDKSPWTMKSVANRYRSFCSQVAKASPCSKVFTKDFLILDQNLVNQYMKVLDTIPYPKSDELFDMIRLKLDKLESQFPKNKFVLHNTAVLYNNYAVKIHDAQLKEHNIEVVTKYQETIVECTEKFIQYMGKWSSITDVK